MELSKIIHEMIENSPLHRIPFSTYMEMALYYPDLGYYNHSKEKVGRSGDFYTNSSVHALYGRLWAKRFIQAWEELGLLSKDAPLIVMEVGGGNGDFAKSVLDELEKEANVYNRLHYYVCEQSPYHLSLQQEKLAQHQANIVWFSNVQEWLKHSLPKPSIIFSNELFDALPVDRLKRDAQGYKECWVTSDHGKFMETWIPLEREELLHYVEDRNLRLPLNHEYEISLYAQRLYQDLIQALDQGYIFTVDYGYLDEEFLHPTRKNGTLIGYYRHQHVTDFYLYPGEFDLTAHVHFEDLIRWGKEMGVQTISYLTQREWLMEQQIFNYLQEHLALDPFSPIAKQNRAVMQLAMGEMGSTFKVLTQMK